MSTITPTGEDIRRAVKWISENMEGNPDQSRIKIIEQAVLKFDLSPIDAEFLMNFVPTQVDRLKAEDC
ncbi:MAG: hypothetical protein Q7I93_01325 [Syntrophales bacterium]|nr:hypothetical protein [Syntrophales bacterium]